MKMNLKPVLTYRIKDSIYSIASFIAVIAVVTISFIFIALKSGNAEFSLTAYGFPGAIMMLVVGIICVRETLRICLQFGTSRKTLFASEIVGSVFFSLIIAIAIELIIAAAQAATASYAEINVFDLFQILYLSPDLKTLSFAQHIASTLVNCSLFISVYAAGAFISMLFYRLSKTWKIAVAIGVPVFFFILLPIGIDFLGLAEEISSSIMSVMNWISSDVVNWFLFFLGSAVIISAINWLLIRRAPVIPASNS